MSHLTTAQRKLAYFIGIIVLLVPIIWLGRPAGRDEPGQPADRGKLTQLRDDYELGESTLGDVDPASSAMTLLLLGGRGIVVNQLHEQANEFRDHKQWAALKAVTKSITLLQPHYTKIWDFQSWNLAYNVSAEWDNVVDRYYWVKEGGKFMMDGSSKNARSPDLAFSVGNRYLGQKIGRSDEWQFFRDYFIKDPNQKEFNGGPDPDFNRGYDVGPQGDNYLAARDWHLEANRREETYPPQHVMMRELFRSYPARSYLEMANVLQKEGVFEDVDLARTGRPISARTAWELGNQAWTEEFGREPIPTEHGAVRLEINSPLEYAELARRNETTEEQVRQEIDFYQKTTNYGYWRDRSRAEAAPTTAAAHREIFRGQQLLAEGKTDQSREMLLSGMRKLEATLQKFPKIEDDDLAVEESLLAMTYVRYAYDLIGEPVPADLPLQRIWDEYQSSDDIQKAQDQFRRNMSGR